MASALRDGVGHWCLRLPKPEMATFFIYFILISGNPTTAIKSGRDSCMARYPIDGSGIDPARIFSSAFGQNKYAELVHHSCLAGSVSSLCGALQLVSSGILRRNT